MIPASWLFAICQAAEATHALFHAAATICLETKIRAAQLSSIRPYAGKGTSIYGS